MTGLVTLGCRIVIAVCSEILDVLEPEQFGPVIKWGRRDTDYRMEPHET